MTEYGYTTRNLFLFGSPSKGLATSNRKVYSWGAHLNKTFDQMLSNILPDILEKKDSDPKIFGGKNYLTERVFVARYGYCIRVRHYDFTKISILTMNQTSKVYILIADKNKHTYPNPNFSSKSGELIYLTPGVEKWYRNKITVVSNEDPLQKEECRHYGNYPDTYENCVDLSISEIMITRLGCNPPYLSPNNKCNTQIINDDYTFAKKFFSEIDYWNSYLMKLIDMEPMTIQDTCSNPCLTTHVNVQLHSEGPSEHPKPTYAKVNLSFKKKVEKRYRVISYDFYNFLIDIGSSLGMWLGLSLLSLTDGAMQLVNSVRSCLQWSKI